MIFLLSNVAMAILKESIHPFAIAAFESNMYHKFELWHYTIEQPNFVQDEFEKKSTQCRKCYAHERETILHQTMILFNCVLFKLELLLKERIWLQLAPYEHKHRNFLKLCKHILLKPNDFKTTLIT